MKEKMISKVVTVILLVIAMSACETTPTGPSNIVIDSEQQRSYVIGPGDVLHISVWKEEAMQKEVVVKPDGGISFPLIGEVVAGGKTTNELKQELVEKLKRFIPNPVVNVSVASTRSNKIYVVGKVNRPGEYTTSNYMDVLQALSMAGGLTAFADSEDIKVIRKLNGKTKVFLFDYDDVISGERLDMNILLKAGDTVVVP